MDGSADRSTLNPVVRRVLERADAKRRGETPREGTPPPREVVVLTREMILEGMSKRGFLTPEQLKILGVEQNPRKGWITRLVGCEVWRDSYKKYLSLRVGPPRQKIEKTPKFKTTTKYKKGTDWKKVNHRPRVIPRPHGPAGIIRATKPRVITETPRNDPPPERVVPNSGSDDWREQQ